MKATPYEAVKYAASASLHGQDRDQIGDLAEWAAEVAIDALAEAGYAVVPIPTVAFKGPHDTDTGMLARAAENLDQGYPLGGGNVTRAVVRLLRDVAAVGRD